MKFTNPVLFPVLYSEFLVKSDALHIVWDFKKKKILVVPTSCLLPADPNDWHMVPIPRISDMQTENFWLCELIHDFTYEQSPNLQICRREWFRKVFDKVMDHDANSGLLVELLRPWLLD